MKTKAFATFTLLVLAESAVFAGIYPAVPGDLCATIPFDFIVGSKVLPAGQYMIQIDDQSGEVEICEDGVRCESILSSPVEAIQPYDHAELAFRKYGKQYFLSQIWRAGGTGRHLADSSLQPNRLEATCTWEAAFIEAKPLCVHQNAAFNLTPTWH